MSKFQELRPQEHVQFNGIEQHRLDCLVRALSSSFYKDHLLEHGKLRGYFAAFDTSFYYL